jgi:hypothetical protein
VRRFKTAVCWDKDSTLGSTLSRQWMVPEIKKGRKTWDDYSRACSDDPPVEAARVLMRELGRLHSQIVMSGATDCPEARIWLREHEFPYDGLYLRPKGDYTENGLLKVRWIKDLQFTGCRVVLFVEDWPDTADTIRKETGVPVLVLNPCYPAELEAAKAVRRAGNT